MEHPSDYGDDIPDLPSSWGAKIPEHAWLQMLRNQQTLIAQNEEILRLLRSLQPATTKESRDTPETLIPTLPNIHQQLIQMACPDKLPNLLPLLYQLELFLTTDCDREGAVYVFDKDCYALQDIYSILRNIKPLLRVTTHAYFQFIAKNTNLSSNLNTVKANYYYPNQSV